MELLNLKSRLYEYPFHTYVESVNNAGSSFFKVTSLTSLMKVVTGAVPEYLPAANLESMRMV